MTTANNSSNNTNAMTEYAAKHCGRSWRRTSATAAKKKKMELTCSLLEEMMTASANRQYSGHHKVTVEDGDTGTPGRAN